MNQKQPPQMWTNTAFTLIELLVVVAIIAILAAMLLPGLSRARESSRAAQCMSNVKQVALALNIYADDWSDAYPPYTSASGSPWEFTKGYGFSCNWQRHIATVYLKEPTSTYNDVPTMLKSLMRCPSDNSPLIEDGWKGVARIIAINGQSQQGFGYGLPVEGPWGVTLRRRSTIKSPSQLVLAGDWVQKEVGFFEWGYCGRYGGPCSVALDLYKPFMCRHNDSMNFAFVDGHVERWPWKKFLASTIDNGGWYNSPTWDWNCVN